MQWESQCEHKSHGFAPVLVDPTIDNSGARDVKPIASEKPDQGHQTWEQPV